MADKQDRQQKARPALEETISLPSPVASGKAGSGRDEPDASDGSGRLPVLRPGDRVGGCLVSRFLAWGGMGEVYEGRHETLDRRVAIKLIREKYADDPKYRVRFLREAKIAAQFTEPHIAIVFDAGERGRQLYVVFEFIEGEDVGRKTKRLGLLPPVQALRIARDAALGLAAAHEKGVIHRDVKPSNIMVTNQGVAKLTDFGLVRIMHTEEKAELEGVIGTPQYMAPEQWQNQNLDARADVYSLGITLYEMLCGKLPTKGETLNDIYTQATAHQLIPLRERHPGLEPQLYSLVESALLPLEERLPSMAEFVKRIDRIVIADAVGFKEEDAASYPISGMESTGGRPLLRPPPVPKSAPSWTPVLVVLLLLASLGFFVVSWTAHMSGNRNSDTAPVTTALPPIKLEWSVLGKRKTPEGNPQRVDLLRENLVKPADELEVRVTPHQDCCLYVVWLPASGEARVLHPSNDPRSAHVHGNKEIAIPSDGPLAIPASGDEDALYVAASYDPPEQLCRLLKQMSLHKGTPIPRSEWLKALQAARDVPPPRGFSLESTGTPPAPVRKVAPLSFSDGHTEDHVIEQVTGAAGLCRRLALTHQAVSR